MYEEFHCILTACGTEAASAQSHADSTAVQCWRAHRDKRSQPQTMLDPRLWENCSQSRCVRDSHVTFEEKHVTTGCGHMTAGLWLIFVLTGDMGRKIVTKTRHS